MVPRSLRQALSKIPCKPLGTQGAQPPSAACEGLSRHDLAKATIERRRGRLRSRSTRDFDLLGEIEVSITQLLLIPPCLAQAPDTRPPRSGTATPTACRSQAPFRKAY